MGGYALTDSEFMLNGISAYGQVMYCNALGLLPLAGVGLATGEHRYIEKTGFDSGSKAMCALALSCVVGVGIAWAVWNCRNQVSATTFTLIGVVCKLISVFLNVIIWDKHATPQGIAWLIVCLVCSSAYKQAPLKGAPPVAPTDDKQAPATKDKVVIGNPEDLEELDGLMDEDRGKSPKN